MITLNENTVKVLGVPTTGPTRDSRRRFTFKYTEDGVEKRGRLFVQVKSGDTPEDIKAKAIEVANNELGI